MREDGSGIIIGGKRDGLTFEHQCYVPGCEDVATRNRNGGWMCEYHSLTMNLAHARSDLACLTIGRDPSDIPGEQVKQYRRYVREDEERLAEHLAKDYEEDPDA